jgi:hypothetical protein
MKGRTRVGVNMAGLSIWGAFATAVTVLCYARPQVARVVVGCFFAAMGLGIHGTYVMTAPHAYVDAARNAAMPFYRGVGLALTQPSPRVFGVFMLVLETSLSVMVLSRGRVVNLGLVGVACFLLAISPLNVQTLPNAIMAAGVAYLVTQRFPRDAVFLVRCRFDPARAARPTSPQSAASGEPDAPTSHSSREVQAS